MLRVLAILVLPFAFSSCKQQLQSSPSGENAALSGRASAGPIRSADIAVYGLWADGSRRYLLAETTTNSTGLYSLIFPRYDGPIEVVVRNGYYFEEATNSLVALVHEELRARLHSLGEANVQVSVTPLTEIAASRSDHLIAQGLTLPDAIVEANFTTALAAGLENILAPPADPWSPLADPSADESKYAAVLAGISQMATDSGMNSLKLAQALANDFSDGAFDGLSSFGIPVQFVNGQQLGANGWQAVDVAVNKFINSGANSAGFSQASETSFISEPQKEKNRKKRHK